LIKDGIGHVPPGAVALTRLLPALVVWRRRAVRRRKRGIDGLSGHLLRDVGLHRG
jgi:hypothetical protein